MGPATINSQGHCLLCQKPLPRERGVRRVPVLKLRTICRYLGIEPKFRPREPVANGVDGRRIMRESSEVYSANLCAPCYNVTVKLDGYVQVAEGLRAIEEEQFKQFREALTGGEATAAERTRAGTMNTDERRFREKLLKNCAKKAAYQRKNANPRLVIPKLALPVKKEEVDDDETGAKPKVSKADKVKKRFSEISQNLGQGKDSADSPPRRRPRLTEDEQSNMYCGGIIRIMDEYGDL